MPFGYHIDLPRGLVLTRAWGVVTNRDLFGHATALARDPQFRRDMRQLADFRGMTDVGFDSASVHAMVGLNPFGKGARRAVLVPTDVGYGMVRMYQMLRDPALDELDVFRQLDAALEWLGLQEDAAEVTAALADIHGPPGPPP